MNFQRIIPDLVATALGFVGGLLAGLTGNLVYLAVGGAIAYEAYRLMDSRRNSDQHHDEDSDLFI